MAPSLAGSLPDGSGILLLGEALGAAEEDAGEPFVGPAGFRLTRLLQWAGVARDRVSIANAVWCRPPGNKLAGEPYEHLAGAHCRSAHWGHLLAHHSVVVPLGGVPTAALLGKGEGILKRRGYVTPVAGSTAHAIPTVHPAFILRGQAKWSAAFIHDIRKAAELAAFGLPPLFRDFVLDPTPDRALRWAQEAVASGARIAFDIETPYKRDADEDDINGDDDPTYTIERIGFSVGGGGALSIPWSAPYFAAVRLLMSSPNEKVVWNAGYDVPRLSAAGFAPAGLVHDGMVAWHVLHSDLPKSLGFVATFTSPWQPAWKHLSGAKPAFYNATDAIVEWEAMEWIERELRATGLWDVYERDVLRLDPILTHMSQTGMPIDPTIRLGAAQKLTERLHSLAEVMEAAVPHTLRSYDPPAGFVRPPADCRGLHQIIVDVPVTRCDRCGLVSPTAVHFKTLKRPTAKRPQNPCAGAGKVTATEPVNRWARLERWSPSKVALIAYNNLHRRPTPTQYDKKAGVRKPTMNEKSIKILMGKHPDDPLYPVVLEYRDVEKIAGTYVGKVVE